MSNYARNFQGTERKIVKLRRHIVLTSFLIFKEPVVAADGHTYEKAALERWFKNHNLSPITGAELDNKIMVSSLVYLFSLSFCLFL